MVDALPETEPNPTPWQKWIYGAAGVVATAIFSLLLQLGDLSWIVLVVLLTGVGATVVGLRWWQRSAARRRARAALQRLPQTAFIGIEPHSERRAGSFFGRDEEAKEIVDAIRTGEHVVYTLHGRSGAGKTSLVRAALLPTLTADGYTTAYVRVADHPLEAVATALAQAGVADTRADGPALAAAVHRHFASSNERVVVFVDHFEQFFELARAVRDEFIDWIGRLDRHEHRCVHVVLVLRQEALAHLGEFDAAVSEVLAPGSRFELLPFSSAQARSALRLLTRGETSDGITGSIWEPGLLDAVVTDLQRGGGAADPNRAILPAELQIVCHTLQRRGVTRAADYPGRSALLTDYVASAVRALHEPEAGLAVLAQLAEPSGRGKRPPRTSAEVAESIPGHGTAKTAALLDQLDRWCRLVVRTRDGSYELAHDHLAGPIVRLAAPESHRTERSNRLLLDARRRAITHPRFVLWPWTAWRIHRHATEPLSASDRALLRRSRNVWLRRAAITLLGLPLLRLAVLNGFVHLDYRDHPGGFRTTVAREGLRWLQPLLGTREIVFDTGIEPRRFQSVGEMFIANQQWFLHFAPFADHYVDHYLWIWRADKMSGAVRGEETRRWLRAASDYEIQLVSPHLAHELNDLGRTQPEHAAHLFEVMRNNADPPRPFVTFIARSLPENDDVTRWLEDLASSEATAFFEATEALAERGPLSAKRLDSLADRSLHDQFPVHRGMAAELLRLFDEGRARDLTAKWCQQLSAASTSQFLIERWARALVGSQLSVPAASVLVSSLGLSYVDVSIPRALCEMPALEPEVRDLLLAQLPANPSETNPGDDEARRWLSTIVVLVAHGETSDRVAETALAVAAGEDYSDALADLVVASCASEADAREHIVEWLMEGKRWFREAASAQALWARLADLGGDLNQLSPLERDGSADVVGGWLAATGATVEGCDEALGQWSASFKESTDSGTAFWAAIISPRSPGIYSMCRSHALEPDDDMGLIHWETPYWRFLAGYDAWDAELRARVVEWIRASRSVVTLPLGVRRTLEVDPAFQRAIVERVESGRVRRSSTEVLRAYATIRWQPHDGLPTARASRLAEALVSPICRVEPVQRWAVLAAIELAAFGPNVDRTRQPIVDALWAALLPLLERDLLVDRAAAAEAMELLEPEPSLQRWRDELIALALDRG